MLRKATHKKWSSSSGNMKGKETAEANKTMTWGAELPNDCRNSGNADTHSTGNRQRLDTFPVVQSVDVRRPERDRGVGGSHEAHVSDQFLEDQCLTTCGVPDTACRKTLVGKDTLHRIESQLLKSGMKVKRAKISNEFKFGNAGTLQSSEVAMIPGHIAGKRIVVKAAVLPGTGAETPLLLSKEFLRQLGTVIHLGEDQAVFLKLGVKVKLLETLRGHYALPLFDFTGAVGDAECCVAEGTGKKRQPTKQNTYDIDQLESVGSSNSDNPDIPCELPHHGVSSKEQGKCSSWRIPLSRRSSVSIDSADAESIGRAPDDMHECGSRTRSSTRFSRCTSSRKPDPESGQVQQDRNDSGTDLPHGQGLLPVGSRSHQGQKHGGHETSPCVHRICGQEQARAPARATGTDANARDASAAQEEDSTWPDSRTSTHRGDRHGVGADEQPWTGGHTKLGGHDGAPGGEGGVQESGALPTCATSPTGSSHPRSCSEGIEQVMSRKAKKNLHRNVAFLNAQSSHHAQSSGEGHAGYSDVYHVNLGLGDHGVDVAEVFSVPRLCPVAEKRGLVGGKSYDIVNGWDFLDENKRKQCLEEIRTHKPRHVHVSLPCGPFSSMQRLTKGKEMSPERRRRRVEAEVLLRFGVQVCQLQRELGGDFSFEHPKTADSWMEECVQDLMECNDVHEVVFDQCCFGLKDPVSGKPYQKGTRIITTNEYMKRLMNRRCNREHVHERLEGQIKIGGKWVNRTRCAQVYPRMMVETMIKAIRMKRNGDQVTSIQGEHEVMAVEPLEEKTENLMESIRRCHNNLGHPSRERFLHLLKTAGASEKALRMAKDFQCEVCLAKNPPSTHPVVKTRKAYGFNEQLCADVFEVGIYDQKKLKVLNMICEGSGLQVCVPLWKGAKSSEIRKMFRKYWKRWAGTPKQVLVDGGMEFLGPVQTGFDDDNTMVKVTAADSPWQNGFCERHGGLWKNIFGKAFDELCDKVNESKNSMIRKHGYSPMQHVFGCDLRVPQSLLDDGVSLPFQHNLLIGSENHCRAQNIRQAARRALVAMDDAENVRRATHRQSRPERRPFETGDYVYYWRRDKDKHGVWKGPARVILVSSNPRVAYG